MKKMIYAVKSGRKTGIFNGWQKCSEQTDKFPNAEFRRFEYQSELEKEPEDVPGSLRYAVKEAEEYLGELVYLGESADYLEDRSWVEDGFLPFGGEPEAEDVDEEYDEWLANRKNALETPVESWGIEYWKIALDMKKCVDIIMHGRFDTERKTAASNLKRHLERCALDVNLSDLTAIYRNLREENAIGYNPKAVARFVTRMANRYPKP